ncbi:unnamed protein product [Candida verbasci]|uniref:Rho-GAP domain-containing protein n=1 Tax=Candida verbasci TaxID=1227364 RepID=A0A9W4TU44_9ASCO|nr:unnamed protein product [Candida verbasci]
MDRIFYKTTLRDPITNYPIYIFDTSYLPSPEDINYDEFIITLMNILPLKPYILIIFSCGLNKLSWIWGLKFFKNFLDSNNNDITNLIKIFIIHDSWFLKSLTSIIHNFNSTKKNLEHINKLLDTFTINPIGAHNSDHFQTIVIHCKTLSELSNYLDLTNLKISLNIYKYNLQFEREIKLSMTVLPIINPTVKLNQYEFPILYHHLYQLFNIMNENCTRVEMLFYKPGNKVNTDLLYQCILRNQLIWINDWDLYSISTTFKKILMELPYSLINTEVIELPIEDTIDYSKRIFMKNIEFLRSKKETENYDQLLLQFFTMLNKIYINQHITKHTSVTLSKCLSHCLSHEIISNKNSSQIQIVSRFIKGAIENWNEISRSYKIVSIQDSINGRGYNNGNKSRVENFDTSYDINYDLTIEEDDDEERVKINTTNILQSNNYLKHTKPKDNNENQETKTIKPSIQSSESKTTKSNTEETDKSVEKSKQGTGSNTIVKSRKKTQSIDSTSTNIAKQPKVHKKTLSDVSNIQIQFPPQKYKFEVSNEKKPNKLSPLPPVTVVTNSKKPVIRGRKVGQLAKLFEERCEGIEILNKM